MSPISGVLVCPATKSLHPNAFFLSGNSPTQALSMADSEGTTAFNPGRFFSPFGWGGVKWVEVETFCTGINSTYLFFIVVSGVGDGTQGLVLVRFNH